MVAIVNGVLRLDADEGSVSGGVLRLTHGGTVAAGVLTVYRKPEVPSGLAAAASTTVAGRITLTWNAAARATGYQLSVNGGTWFDASSGHNYAGTAGTTYSFRVRATRTNAAPSAPSATVRATGRSVGPAPPTGVSAVNTRHPLEPGQILNRYTLTSTWRASAGATGYRIRYLDVGDNIVRTVDVGNVLTTSNTERGIGFHFGVSISNIEVQAYNAQGSSAWTRAWVTSSG